MTAAATTGPARDPRPTSSRPAMRRYPSRRRASSCAQFTLSASASDVFLFRNPSGLSTPLTQVVKFGTPDAARTGYLDLIEDRRVQRKNPLHSYPIGDFSHRERSINPSPPTRDYHPLEDLNSFLLSFTHFDVHLHRIA